MAFISSILYIIILLNTIAAIITVFREPREIAATWGMVDCPCDVTGHRIYHLLLLW